jgi:hypothetical protein
MLAAEGTVAYTILVVWVRAVVVLAAATPVYIAVQHRLLWLVRVVLVVEHEMQQPGEQVGLVVQMQQMVWRAQRLATVVAVAVQQHLQTAQVVQVETTVVVMARLSLEVPGQTEEMLLAQMEVALLVVSPEVVMAVWQT